MELLERFCSWAMGRRPSRFLGWFLAAQCLALGMALWPSRGMAAPVSLPDATFVEAVGSSIPEMGAIDPDPSTPNALSLDFTATNGNGSAQLTGSAATAGGARPMLSVSATADGGASHEIDPSAQITYFFAVSGPASVTAIPLLVTFSGAGTASGLVADGVGRIRIDQVSGPTTLLSETLGVSSVFGPPADSFGGGGAVQVDVDQVYEVFLEGTARAQANGGVSQAEVTVDPLIMVDPAFADRDLYQIVYSANVVPEPGRALLVGVTLAAIASRRLLRRFDFGGERGIRTPGTLASTPERTSDSSGSVEVR